MPTHPDARCRQCSACSYVESTKQIVLAHSAPLGPGIKQAQADLWNKTLAENPCACPLIFVTYDHHTVEGRVITYDQEAKGHVLVMTLRYGKILVPDSQISDWEPQKLFETLDYVTIANNLQNMPATWYPGLLEAVIRGAYKAKTFSPTGASSIVRRLEALLWGHKTESDGK
jgi:hypothetical protein